jgi:hypothetical protein
VELPRSLQPPRPLTIPTRPEPIEIDLGRTALVVVDMQNAFVKMSYNKDYSNSGGPDSPNWRKELGLVMMRRNPEYWADSSPRVLGTRRSWRS